MKHSIQELIERIYLFYPNGIRSADLRFKESEENRRLLDTKRRAAAEVERFRALLDRLQERFPGSSIHEMLDVIPKVMDAWDVCFLAELDLPTVPRQEGSHALVMLVSILAPYYLLYSSLYFNIKGDKIGRAKHVRYSFAFSPEEQPYARAIADEIEATYGHAPMPPEIGNQLVPEVSRQICWRSDATIYDCLFTDQIW